MKTFGRARAPLRTLLASGAAVSALCLAGIAHAQTAPAAEPAQAEPAGDQVPASDIIVTGSRIASPSLTSPSPLQAVTAQLIENAGATNVQDVLQQIPAVGVPSQSRVTGGNDTNPGLATVNLRNLGSDRTLVLIDGRRTVAGIPGTAQVDLSMIPAPFIERVDVLTGGASAVYGSDAIAGVVNFIYKKKFEGLRLNVQSGISEHGDDWRFAANATFGQNFAGDRGNLMVYAGWNQEGAVDNADRERTATSFASLGNSQRVGGNNDANLTAAQNLFTRLYAPSNVGPGGIFNFGGSGNRIILPDGTFRGYNVALDGFNAAPYGQIASPSKQITLASRLNYDVTDHVNVFFESTYVNYRTNGRREASPMRTDSALGAFTGTGGYYPIQFSVLNPNTGQAVILNNPLVPAAVFAAADNRNNNDAINSKDMSFLIRTTMFPPGTRSTPTERDNFRVAGGAKIDLGGSWNLDAYYQYGFTKQNQRMTGLADLYRLAEALQVIPDAFDYDRDGNTTEAICVNANARAQGCVPIDVYGLNPDGTSKISQAAVDYLRTEMSRESKQEMQVAAVNLTGSLFKLPAGPVQVSVGAEYRRESSKEDFDPLTNAARNGYVQLLDTHGSFNVKELYGEIVVPILSDTPFFDNLTLRGAGRMSDYSTVGTFYAWNVGAEWSPIPDIRFRGVYALAVRAPNIGELFAASAAGIITITDPCQGVTLTQTGSTAENCRADPGVLANIRQNGSFTLTFSDTQGVGGITASNPDIREETGKTLTLGVVVNPRSIDALRNLTLTADYFDIKLEGAINRLSAATVLNKCYRDGLADFCQFVTRRSQASGAFSVGSVEQIVRGLVNSGGSFTRGLDFTLSYSHDVLGGKASLTGSWTHLLKNGFNALTGDPYDNTMGEIGSPRDTANVSLSWDNDDFGFTVSNDYVGPQMFDYENYQTTFRLADGSLPDKKYFTIDSKIYTDAQLRFKGIDRFEFYVGVNNLFDVQPPSIYAGPPASNANAIWDPIGRRYYAGVRLNF
ncbi:TonB-dependent receptor [Sphingomonas cannabina]|uniref:TonB-dependent receptor plug domain-containing protein n=1 Tax=Sphingomonas cannabina TaxID=2899123 RepID=UPI001F286FBC|nr:TonB-dependent receptor [Sphingomonas cannabina]UIJ45256.1 TonB-dependent receptor [Sphingomonas cannabina]